MKEMEMKIQKLDVVVAQVYNATQEQLNATTKEVVRILQNHEDTIKKTTGNNVVMVNYIDMLAKHTTERGMEIRQIAQVINQQAMTQQQFGIAQQVIGGAVGKLIGKQKEKEERKGNGKVESEETGFSKKPRAKEFGIKELDSRIK